MFGRINYVNNVFSISLLLYDSEVDEIMYIEKGQVSNIIDTFDLADSLSISILESFIGRELAFGSLYFDGNNNADKSIAIYINDTYIGNNLGAVSPILSGTYQLRVEQQEYGSSIILFNGLVTISESEITSVSYQTKSFGFLDIKLRGPNMDSLLLLNDEEVSLCSNTVVNLDVGDYNLIFYQKDDIGGPYFHSSQNISIEEGLSANITLERYKLSSGFYFNIVGGNY